VQTETGNVENLVPNDIEGGEGDKRCVFKADEHLSIHGATEACARSYESALRSGHFSLLVWNEFLTVLDRLER